MPTEIVTVYPKCQAVDETRDTFARVWRWNVCKADGARYLIIGELGVIEQNLCHAHLKKAKAQHKGWKFHELKWAVKKEVREVREVVSPARTPVSPAPPVADDDIPF